MPLQYSQAGPTTTTHDRVYSTLLGALVVLLVFAILTLDWIIRRAANNPSQQSALSLIMAVYGLFAAAITIVLLIRLLYPTQRRWPTLGLNIILVFFIPLGTALAIYGFWKVDKLLRQPPPSPPQGS